MSDVLAKICAVKRERVASRKHAKSIGALEREIVTAPKPRGFAAALSAKAVNGYALIAEIKKASPSAGLIRKDLDAPAIAKAYERGGAACLSVLTEEDHFEGSDAYLQAARAATAPLCLKIRSLR